ncbi:hypothetical protein F2Q69_00059743 [Brassica cretica]|uniref:Uncharacterized protein n=1 Tax=Brassica cretica TaxID=69181 RepID=A0A8S9RN96_BRACR|nr:hypothetical protein F2Q69_00059743 [Brassica cretica]
MVETEDLPSINLVVESRAVKIDREILKNEVVEELIHDVLEARRFTITTFLQHEVFRKTLYQRNNISKTLEAGRDLSRTGSKHDGIEARRENPKLDENPNFGIMEVFDEAEGSGNIYRKGQSVPFMIMWRYCPELVQFHGFRSVEVLLDTPPRSSKNCPEAKGRTVRVQIRPSRPVSVYMVKPRFCPRRDQFSPVQSSHPLGFGQVSSDQPAAYRQRTL